MVAKSLADLPAPTGHLCHYCRVHLDERWPGTFETLSGQLAGGIDSKFRADSNFARGMIQDVRRAFGENGIALWVSRGAQTEKDLAGVMHIHVVIHHNNILGKHHLPHPPQAMHDFIGLHRIRLLDTYEDQVVKHSFGGQSYVYYLREVHFEDWKKQLH